MSLKKVYLLEGIKETTECEATEVTVKENMSASANNHILDDRQLGKKLHVSVFCRQRNC